MSQEIPNNQEIDVFKLLNSILIIIKNNVQICFEILIKHFFKFLILLILGFVLGSVLSSNFKNFESKIIVQPNFGSVNYLYDKVELFNSKLKSKDTLFFSKIGFNSTDEILDIKIEPIIDVYSFVKGEQDKNFEMIKLQAEDGSISKIIEDSNTSKYYNFHTITLLTKKQINKQNYTDLVIAYLNDSNYFSKIQNQFVKDLNEKNLLYQNMLEQIDNILNKFSNLEDSKSDKLVYYNDNTQLNDVLNTKSDIITKISTNNIILLQSDKTIKEISVTTNSVNSKNMLNKLKYILPVLACLFLFIFLYKKQTKN